MKKTIYLIFFISIYFQFGFSQVEKPDRLTVTNKKYYRYMREEKYDSISNLLYKYELNTDLTNREKQYLYFYKGLLNQEIDKPELAIENLKRSITYYDKIKGVSKQVYAFSLSKISDLYFTKENFKKAYDYAILAKPYIDEEYYYEYVCINTIIGYYFYTIKDFSKSLAIYKNVEKVIIKNNDKCKLAEIQTKLAEIYNELDSYDLAIETINKCIATCNDCDEKQNEVNARETKARILKKNNQLKIALTEKDKIIKLKEVQDLNSRNEKIDSLETIYKTQLKEAQNISLQKTNRQKEKENKTQQKIIFATVIGLIALGLMLFYVFKLSKKQKENNFLLTKQKQDLERLNLLNQKIFSVISHDFKGPMINLELLLKLDAQKLVSTSESQQQKKKLSNDLYQANLIMDNLLGWAKNELKISVNNFEKANPYEVCEAVKKQLNYIFEEKNITLVNEIPTDNYINIATDVLLIVVRNLISNALKFSFNDNDIIVSFNKNTDTYSIQDFGMGMSENQLQKIFNAQVETTTGTNNEIGFGLGLNFVNEIIKQNKGSIWIESTLNEGTIVYFKIHGKP
jgi:two-component system, sensor histidine kinase and response regulator